MIYLALLRGINVGGKQKVEMKKLKKTFEGVGLNEVQTYINSGNVIFEADLDDADHLASELHEAIWKQFEVRTGVLLRDSEEVHGVVDALPSTWVNDASAKCDVLFLWDEVDSPEIIDRLPAKPGIDDVMYVPGSVMWRVDRAVAARSGMPRLVGTDLYKAMTIRNCNTVRKLAELISARES